MSNEHIHKYKKVDLTRKKGKPPFIVYRCTKPTCFHYISILLAEGKACECNRCGDVMVITKVVLNGSGGKPMTFPHCHNCTKLVKKVKVEELDIVSQFLEKKG